MLRASYNPDNHLKGRQNVLARITTSWKHSIKAEQFWQDSLFIVPAVYYNHYYAYSFNIY